jgi:hypothetical protein
MKTAPGHLHLWQAREALYMHLLNMRDECFRDFRFRLLKLVNE